MEEIGSRPRRGRAAARRIRQGFPDTWEFIGGIGSVTDQIGNAVVPAVGQAMGSDWRCCRR
ncbi:DNA cytosine methyltransferase [Rhizobium sp. P32RR-XVIII]|uniref:DNA cytosine methyltransferase n=1 Tax=Rhizobium sp. P32RR-XVIII TaxID=2726738 RepID=UPI001FEF3608|nr:DNA cytosine methyltransferase [Rhizobium sp. P32RR-XVIII]